MYIYIPAFERKLACTIFTNYELKEYLYIMMFHLIVRVTIFLCIIYIQKKKNCPG